MSIKQQSKFTLFGITQCDSVKKARRWLDDASILYQFHDYRRDGLNRTILKPFIEQLGYQSLINKRGTTWRKLSLAEQDAINNDEHDNQLICLHPTIIKRPLLRAPDGELLLGFSPTQYQHFIDGKR